MSSRSRRRKAAASVLAAAATTPRPEHQPPARNTTSVTPSRLAISVCLRNEDPADFMRLHQALVAEHRPANASEAMIVDEMAVARWHLQRNWGIETALVDNELDQNHDEIEKTYERTDHPTRTALAIRKLTETTPALAFVHRAGASYSRQFDRCLRRLNSLRANGKKEFPSEPNPGNEHHAQAPQLQPEPGAAASPQSAPRLREPLAVAPAAPTPEMESIYRQIRGNNPDSLPGNSPSFPRAA